LLNTISTKTEFYLGSTAYPLGVTNPDRGGIVIIPGKLIRVWYSESTFSLLLLSLAAFNIVTFFNMKAFAATALAFLAPATALLRFPCAQLVIDRLDPLVTPGQAPSPHLHQILGGVSSSVV
jgi:hypothetical protein